MMNVFLQNNPEAIENLILPDSVQKARFAEAVRHLADMDMQDIWRQMAEWIVWTGIKIVISLVIFYAARWALRRVVAFADRVMTLRRVEISLHSFLLTAIKTLGYVIIFITLVSILGFDSTTFVAMLASMGLAIGMALSDLFGGIGAVSTAAIAITGIGVNMFGVQLCKRLNITDPIAQGVAFGTAGHVIGTAKASEVSPLVGAVSSLSLVVAGILTSLLFPILVSFL